MDTPAVAISQLTKDYPLSWGRLRVRAVEALSLEIPQNTVFGLLGPNGSGKSTTLKSLLGLLRPTAGSCHIFGRPSMETEARRRVGYLPESPDFYRFLTGRELLQFFGRISGMDQAAIAARTESILRRVRLSDAADRRLATYSKGMLQRIGLAQALVHDPDLIILDEPTSGVDPVGAEAIGRIIRELKAEGKTILLCSHLLGQVEALCDAVAILIRGRCVLQGTLDSLLREAGVAAVQVGGWEAGAEPRLEEALRACGLQLRGVEPERRRLENLFLEKAREGRKEAGDAG